jgi:aminoglycoside 3-N-acetyltransferase I
MTFSIQELGPNELMTAQRLFEMWRHEDNVTKPPPSSETLLRLLSRPDFHAVAALRGDGDGEEVIGGLTAYELEMYTEAATELFVYEVGVAAPHRRQGVGRALIEFARNLCRSRGLSALYIPAMADDARAVAFYQSTGLKREDVAWFVQEFETPHEPPP